MLVIQNASSYGLIDDLTETPRQHVVGEIILFNLEGTAL